MDVATATGVSENQRFDGISRTLKIGCCLAKALDPNNRLPSRAGISVAQSFTSLGLAMTQPENVLSKKRVKSGSQITHQFAFTNVHDIKQALRTTQDPSVLSKGL